MAGLCASPAGCCWCPRPPTSIVSEQGSRICRPSRLLRPAGGVQLQLRASQKAGLTYPVSTTGRTTSICCITWALFACTSSLLNMSGHSFSLACRGHGRLEQENNFCGSDCEEQPLQAISPATHAPAPARVKGGAAAEHWRTVHAVALLSPTESHTTPSKSRASTIGVWPALSGRLVMFKHIEWQGHELELRQQRTCAGLSSHFLTSLPDCSG